MLLESSLGVVPVFNRPSLSPRSSKDFDKVYASNVIMERLKKFCDFFEEFINNTKWQEEMVLGDVNRNMYNLYCKDYLML